MDQDCILLFDTQFRREPCRYWVVASDVMQSSMLDAVQHQPVGVHKYQMRHHRREAKYRASQRSIEQLMHRWVRGHLFNKPGITFDNSSSQAWSTPMTSRRTSPACLTWPLMTAWPCWWTARSHRATTSVKNDWYAAHPGVLYADETPVVILKLGNGKTHRAHLWASHRQLQRLALRGLPLLRGAHSHLVAMMMTSELASSIPEPNQRSKIQPRSLTCGDQNLPGERIH